VGKNRRSNGTFAYINPFSSPSLPSESGAALSQTSEVGIDGVAAARSTCRSMETGYLPVTFCGKIFPTVALLAHPTRERPRGGIHSPSSGVRSSAAVYSGSNFRIDPFQIASSPHRIEQTFPRIF